MQIDVSDEHFKNAQLPTRASFESDSNVTLESRQQPAKQLSQTILTEEGMEMCEINEQPENA
jgi:hypothetical protein